MNWYTAVVFYTGVFDAGLIMAGSLLLATVILLGLNPNKLWNRVFPALWCVVGGNFAAAVTLVATHWLIN